MGLAKSLNIAVFASDKGPGDAERSSIMTQAGAYLARKGARIICPAGNDNLCTPLLKSAQKAGGDILVIGGPQLALPSALANVEIERIADMNEADRRVYQLADAYLVLPGSLASATRLFNGWVSGGALMPIVMLNRNRAFEVMRGFAMDVLSHSVNKWEDQLQFADSVEEAWDRLSRMAVAD